MTDDELAKELEFHAKRGISAAPALLHEASERIYALSAHNALLKASLAQAEREAEKATASAEPFGYFRVTPLGWEDCAETDDGAIPLYSAPQPAANAEPAIPAFDCWSSGDGECWHLHPADACILDTVFSDGAPKVGDEYEVLAGWRSVDARYRITSVDEDGDVEVECISHAREAAPQPDRVADLERELREARDWIAMVHEWFDRESSIIYELSESIRVDIAQAAAAEREACAALAQGWNTAMTDKLAAAIRARGAKGGE